MSIEPKPTCVVTVYLMDLEVLTFPSVYEYRSVLRRLRENLPSNPAFLRLQWQVLMLSVPVDMEEAATFGLDFSPTKQCIFGLTVIPDSLAPGERA